MILYKFKPYKGSNKTGILQVNIGIYNIIYGFDWT